MAKGVDDRFLILEHTKAQEALSEIEPEPFDRIEFGAVGRQRDQGDVVWDLEGIGAMPAGLVDDHDGMLVFGQGLGELGEEDRHRRRVSPGQDEPERVTGLGRDGAKDVGLFESLVATPRRSPPLLPPAMTEPALLTDARFVLKPQAYGLAGIGVDGSAQRLWQLFF